MRCEVLTFGHTFGGPTGRRCGTCALPVPEGYTPSERLDGSLLLECPECNDRRIEERARFVRIRMGTATPDDFVQDPAQRWRLKVEGE